MDQNLATTINTLNFFPKKAKKDMVVTLAKSYITIEIKKVIIIANT